jgi:titin
MHLRAKARGLFVVATVLVISVGGVVAQAGVAQATATLILTPTTTVFSYPSTTTALSGLNVTGDTTDTLQATVATTLGTLSVSSTSGLTLAYGNAWSGTASVTFTGLESAIDTGLASVSLVTTSTTGTAAVSLTAMVEVSGYNYLSVNQHFYEYVACSGCTWFTADAGAQTLTFAGQPGYLATIPNANVNSFISNNIANANNVWFGARAYESIATDGTQGYATVSGTTYARVWRWTEGAGESPIAGGVISECSNQTGSCSFQNSGSFYTSWNSGEPNNSGGSTTVAYQGEYVPVTNWGGSKGNWNDLPPSNTGASGYVVEFGGKTNTTPSLGTGFAGVETASSNITVATSVSPPAAPTVTATPVDSSALLSWAPPISNGDAITGYDVSTNGGSTWTGSVSTTTTYPLVNGNVVTTINFTVTGLTDGTTYQIKVRADSEAGDGTPSTAQAITPEPAPDAPTNVTATAGDAAANVSWTAGADGGPAVDLWTVTPYNALDVAQTGLAVTSTNPSASSVRVTGLTAGAAYTFTVTAANSMGTGPTGTSSSVTPNASLLVSTTTLSSASYNFAYTTTLLATGGTAPFTWSVVTGSLPAGLTLAASGTISGTPTATGTANFAVQVADSDAATASRSLSLAAVASAPAAPTGVSAVGGNQRAIVTFTAPTNTGSSPVTHYTVIAVDTTNSANGAQSVSGASSPITVNGLTNGDSYTFSVTANNAVGASASSSASNSVVPARTVPDPPTAASATAGNTQASVSFTAPTNNGGDPITGYTVTALDLTSHSLGGQIATGATSPITVTGLTNGDIYTFTVTASSAFGTGVPSSTTSAVTPVTVPGAPAIGIVTAGNSTASVAFTAPAGNGGTAITGYSVTATDTTNAGRGGQSATGPASPISVSGLTNGDSYTFSLQATNAVGTGPASALSALVVPAGPPGAPTAVTGSATGQSGNVSVTFSAPASSDGSAITGYTVTATDTTNGGRGGQSATGATSPITITGLTDGDTYTFSVDATNTAGTGAGSASSAPVLPAGPPGAPTNATATGGDRQASVTFGAPASDNGAGITSYTVTAIDATDGANGGQTVTGAASPLAVTGLTNGDSYTFAVTASNWAGTSSSSSSSAPIVPAGVPGAPIDVSALATGQSGAASVTFGAPASDNGAGITSYTVTATDTTDGANGSQTSTGAASPLTVTGLTNGDSYTFAVTASNPAGPSSSSSSSLAVVPAGPPGHPTHAVATGGNTSATVAFTTPANDNGAPVTVYTITATDTTNSANGGQTATGAASPLTVTGLINGDSYTFRVTASNWAGPSTASAASNAVVPAPTVPDVPTNVRDVAGDTQATVSFDPPDTDGGDAITGYWVVAYDATNFDNGGQIASAANGSVTVTGLTNGDSYTFTVIATNAVGAGNPSLASAAVTPAGLPGAPTGVAGTATGTSGQASVSFLAPANDNGATVTGYTVTATDTTNVANLAVTASGPSSPISVTGLANGDSYTFTVTATNWAGTGASSAPSGPMSGPVAGPPGAPTDVVGTATGTSGEASVSFVAPDDNGSLITSYTVTATDTTNVANLAVTASGPSSPISVTGLADGDNYIFTVTATNLAGTGPSSIASGAMPGPVAGPPSTPTDVVGTATGASGHAAVSFVAPDDNGSLITSYTVTATDTTNIGNPAVTATGASSPISVTGLANGDNYSYTVTATNLIGTSASSAPSGQMPNPVLGPPGAPSATAANGAGPGSATVSWTAGTTNGSNATGWTVTPVLGGQPLSELSQAGLSVATTTVPVTGLTAGETYTFDVVQQSTDGDSPAGESGLVTMPSAPEAPIDVQATVSDTSATVSWTAGDDNGSPISQWTITPVEGGLTTTAVTVEGPATTSALVLGLSPSGSYIFQVVATNAVGTSPTASSASQTLPAALTVSSPASLAVGEVGVDYSDVTLAAGGGTSENSWALATGTPPAGLTLGVDGALSGTPTTGGSMTFTVEVTDSGLATATQEETIDIVPDPEVTGSLLGGIVGTVYSQSLSGADGTIPYIWSVTIGSLPSGLTLTPSSGAISGVPIQSGTSTFTVELTDLNGVIASERYGVTVAAAPVAPVAPIPPTVPSPTQTTAPGTTVEPAGSLGSSYDSQLSGPSSGGPWTWSLSGGALPPGVQLGPNGTLSGMPTAGGAYSFTASAVDPNGDTYLETVVLTVSASPAPTVSPVPPVAPPVGPPGKLPFFSAGAASSFNLTAPGPGPFAWSVASGTLPAGLELSATGQLSGRAAIPGTYVLSFRYVTADGATGLETVTVNVYPSDLNSRPMASTPNGKGYWVVGANGAVKAFGDAKLYGSLVGHTRSPIISMAATPDGEGYWLLAANGAVSAFGNARSYGSTVTRHLNQPVVAMAVTPDGHGYWLIAADGGVFTFGNAHFYGSAAQAKLRQPVVGFAAAPSGTGYWLVTSTGVVLPFGSARSHGSVSDTKLVGTVVGIAAAPDGRGYWLAAKDGGVFAFGSAKFYGSLGRHGSPQPILGIVPTNDGGGYWLVAQDGHVWSFGDATDHGSGGIEVSPHN